MTTPPNNSAPIPVLNRVVSDPIFNDQKEALIWTLRGPHPLVPETYVIVRMFVDRGGAEIYATTKDGLKGMRNIIPTSKIRFIEEAMSINLFAYELESAEIAAAPVGPLSVESDEDGDEPEDDEPEHDDAEPAQVTDSPS